MLLKKGFAYLREYGLRKLLVKVHSKIKEMKKKPQPYHKWIRLHLPSKKELQEQKRHEFNIHPKFSIIASGNSNETSDMSLLQKSLEDQTYSKWEICWVHADNVSEAIKSANGEYLVFAEKDDMLAPNALFECVKVLEKNPEVDLIYSDEDKIQKDGKYHFAPHFKPDFNIDLLCTTNYIDNILVVKSELSNHAGGWNQETESAKKYDYVFRCVENAKKIYHIPKVLYHKTSADDSNDSLKDNRIAEEYVIRNHYSRMGINVEIKQGEVPGVYRTRFIREYDPLVSIIIPNKDHIDDLKRCIDSIEVKSTYKNYEYIIIENNSTEEKTFQFYKDLAAANSKVKVIYWDGPFNYSAINNYGVQYASGEYYLLLNNDTEIINEDCIEELLGYCMRKDVGAVGARLYFDDDTIQHAGVVVGFGGIAGHCFVQQPAGVTGYQHRIVCAQDYSAVTAACMMVRKDVFEEVGGLSPELAVAFNDIDFCMKIRQAGYLIVYNPYAELYHYESKSRGLEDTPEKVARFQKEINTFAARWPEILEKGDPFYNPNLTLDSQDFSLKRL